MKTAAAVFALSILGACAVHVKGPSVPVPSIKVSGPKVIVPAGHFHSDHCGHYFHKGEWYELKGHSHGHGCGHAHVNGNWILQE